MQSGTSADGIDVAVMDVEPIDGAGPDELHLRVSPRHSRTERWPDGLRDRVLDVVHGGALTAAEWCRLDTELGAAFADAAASAAPPDGVDLVVSHGQTVHHWVEGGRARGTLQLGAPAWIAERLDAPVVADLRTADIAAGGEGAPLMAVFDRAWLGADARAAGRPIATANLGGIANVQVVHPDGSVDAHDSGPGNGLLDVVVERATEGRSTYDRDGGLAAAGTVNAGLLAELLAHPYFTAEPPKSTGRETFTHATVDAAIERADAASAPLADRLATLAELTAVTVVGAVPDGVAELVLSGGGVHNAELVRRIRAQAEPRGIRVVTSAERGVDPDAKETLLFGLLGWMRLHGVAAELARAARGAPRVLGTMTAARRPDGRGGRHRSDAARHRIAAITVQPGCTSTMEDDA
ncbi:anhydro-N-acetylmuramic acid kinase [Agromyces aurantiacus]|uniref:Anhydro-N-acetylmuramic acid kinase n=1 Tax=Agromyces aurantiacus TaxID=165814 RepID=A0ABV9R1P4_9MICO|nr:anhydro-N-acetylmuramic acid kinase [Agromyces aurantiacus]MBM7505852.1 anhydro-N-acetylmuramic acid kinase [Agromyces aurantiacus]